MSEHPTPIPLPTVLEVRERIGFLLRELRLARRLLTVAELAEQTRKLLPANRRGVDRG